MGIIRLTLFSVVAVGGAMLWFGRDDGLPDDRLGRDRMEAPAFERPVPVAAPVAAPAPQPDPEPEPQPDPQTTPAPDPPPTPEPEPVVLPVLYVTGNKVNMRAGPATSHGIVAGLVRGTAVDDLGVAAPGWTQIRVIETGKRGFMAARFLSADRP